MHYGHVLDGEIRHVDLTYVDQNTPVVVYDKDWQDNRQRVEVSVLKKEKRSCAIQYCTISTRSSKVVFLPLVMTMLPPVPEDFNSS